MCLRQGLSVFSSIIAVILHYSSAQDDANDTINLELNPNKTGEFVYTNMGYTNWEKVNHTIIRHDHHIYLRNISLVVDYFTIKTYIHLIRMCNI